MSDTIEEYLQRVMKGLSLDSEEAEICDFSLEAQNEALESQGIQPSLDPKYKPILDETVTYIVACVLLNDFNEVLMMQEAKQSCAGKWYLPAGRVEKGETIIAAAQREVQEETGLQIECTTIVTIESARGIWFRFVLTGKVVGGSLKTPSEADKESLQAKWIANLEELELRASDITHLIEKTKAYKEARTNHDLGWFKNQLPALRPYSRILLRLVIVIKKKTNNKVHILLSERTAWHLPTCEVHPSKSIHSTLRRFMIDIFGAEVPAHRPHGILSVEHDPSTGKDGMCLTLLVVFRSPLEEVSIIGKCVWHESPKELGNELLQRIASRNSTLPLHVIK